MRKIKIDSWKAKDRDGSEVEEDTLMLLNILINGKRPEDVPRGLDKFRLFGRIAKAFDKAKSSKILVLEEADYKFLKDTVEKDIPSVWGGNENISKAIEKFLEAKEE